MKLYGKQNVWDAALDRIRRLFDEFPQIVISFSGGKDSTVLLNLALIVAEEKGRLPLTVHFTDQEAEWQTVIDYIRVVMNDPRIDPYWLQCDLRISNAATTTGDGWLHCWEEGAQWIRDKEPNSIHENIMGTDRFGEIFTAFTKTYFPHTPVATLAGVRAEEAPSRLKGLTSYATYKDITWGKKENEKLKHYSFYPLYDWSYTDIWKAIHDNKWPYCKIYDYYYNYGLPVRQMRVSNVHHGTAIKSLTFLQEIEPETWNRIVSRVQGVNAVNQAEEAYYIPKELPFMFSSWREYRDHLLENLIDEDKKPIFRAQFANYDRNYLPEIHDELHKDQIGAVLLNDYYGTKADVFRASHARWAVNRGSHEDANTVPSQRT